MGVPSTKRRYRTSPARRDVPSPSAGRASGLRPRAHEIPSVAAPAACISSRHRRFRTLVSACAGGEGRPRAGENTPRMVVRSVRLGRPVIHERQTRGFIPKLAKTPPTSAVAVLDCLRPREPRRCGRKEWADWPRWAACARRPEHREHRKPRRDSREDDHGHLPSRWPQAARHFAHNSRSFPARGHPQTTVPRVLLPARSVGNVESRPPKR
jgi:hypothetical protein